nr:hypothetical protein [Acidobacteriota bacterium]
MNPRKMIRAALFGLLFISILTLAVFIPSSRSAAQIGGLPGASVIWRDLDAARLPIAPAGTRVITPSRFRALKLDTTALRSLLARAPLEFTTQARGGGRIEVSLPTPDGKLSRF